MSNQMQLDKITKVVAVMAYARAASGLWSSLLDGHPNILTTPDCLLMTFYDFWKESGHLHLNELITAFFEKYNIMFDAREPCKCHGPHRNCGDYLGWTSMGADRSQFIYVDKEKFRIEMEKLLGKQYPVSRKLFFQALHLAYTKGTGKEISWPVIISFGLHVGNVEKTKKLLEDFPDTYFLQTVRNPINGFGSWIRHYDKEHKLNYKDPIFLFIMGLGGAEPLATNRPDLWKAVRLEDIHTQPKKTLEKVCSWLDLSWNDSLMKSTWNGIQWWNEKNAKQVSGFSNKIVNQKFEFYLSSFDKFRLEILLSSKISTWNYESKKWVKTFFAKILVLPLLLFPFKMEFLAVKEPKLEKNFIIRSAYYIWKLSCMYGLCRVVIFWNWLKLCFGKNNNVNLL